MLRLLSAASAGFLFLLFACGIIKAAAQQSHADSLLNLLNRDGRPAYVTATFKATRIINGQSIENVGAGVLDFRVAHRFGSLNQGIGNFFGLDNAVTKIGFDYGFTDWLMAGIGRGTYEKEYDGFIKVKLLRQTENYHMPVSLSYVGSIYIQSLKMPEISGAAYPFVNRMAYMNQLLIARKWSRHFSLQLMPTHIHYNIVPYATDPNNIFALGIGGRVKLSNRIALTGEYYYVFPGASLSGYHNALSFGIDIETGGHVFQLMFTNASAINERVFIGETDGTWSKGIIHFGFNISRVFTIVKPKGF